MELIERLESLRIPDEAFLNVRQETRDTYRSMNATLDDCLEIVWKWLQENNMLDYSKQRAFTIESK